MESEADERAALNAIDRSQADGSASDGTLSLTILPTLACNFRCSYCFEQHPNKRMGPADEDRIEALVRQRLARGGSLSVTWFGGEPLSAFRELQAIHARLSTVVEELDGSFSHSIITNGSLLTEERIAWLQDKGIRRVQVTLDGPPEVHDGRRFTVAGAGTFARIVENLKRAQDRLPISVRVNVDHRNQAFLDQLVDLLAGAGLHNLFVYLGHAESYTDESSEVLDHALTREEFSRLDVEFQYRLFRAGFRRGLASLPSPRLGPSCTATNLSGFVLVPGGLVFQCWNAANLDAAGSYGTLREDGTIDLRDPMSWDRFDPFTHRPCDRCHVQPLCQGGCPWLAREQPSDKPGNCSTLRWSLPEILRLYHLERSLQAPDTPTEST